MPSPMQVNIIQSIEGPSETKKGEDRANSLSSLAGTSELLVLRPVDSRLYQWPSSSKPSTQTKLYHQFSWFSSQQTAGCETSWPTQPLEPILVVNLLSYISIYNLLVLFPFSCVLQNLTHCVFFTNFLDILKNFLSRVSL